MDGDYILGIDQGSTGSKVIVVDRNGAVVLSRNRIRVKERDGKSETGKNRAYQ